MATDKKVLYENLYLECFIENNHTMIEIFNKPLLAINSVIIFSEESNIVAKRFLECQHKSEYILEPRMVNVNLDGEYTDVDFFEALLKNGYVGHLEFDMNSYPRNKVFYVMDKLIQPIVETFDIGKMMDTKIDKKKVVFLKNLDMVLKNTIDEKIFKKVTNWLEKYSEAVTFLFSFNISTSKISEGICSYSIPIMIKKIVNSNFVDNKVEKWILDNYKLEKDIKKEREIITFYGFRYFIRSLIIDDYYSELYNLIDRVRKQDRSDKIHINDIRDVIIEWLQEGKNHYELVHEILYCVRTLDISTPLKIRYINELASRGKYVDNSKKIIYHLESLLMTFMK
jgi:hypothetical protein